MNKRTLLQGLIVVMSLVLAVALVSAKTGHGQGGGDGKGKSKKSHKGHDDRAAIGLAIAPVPLNLDGKDAKLVGLGSYLVNAVGSCNDCHSCPSYAPGHNPYPPVSGDGAINAATYLAGGVDFGPFTSANLTPDASGVPVEGATFDQFKAALRTGADPHQAGNILQVMPWPVLRNMSDGDLLAIYTYLSAIPHADTPTTHCTNAGQ